MESNELEGSKHEPLPLHVADRLLELLSSDDEFRTRFKKDPAAALAQVGHPSAEQYAGKEAIAKGEPFYCMTTNELASKEEIQQSREELKSYLTTYSNHTVIYAFESGKTASTLRLK